MVLKLTVSGPLPHAAEVLIVAGARSARYVLLADFAREAEAAALADAKSRGFRRAEVLQTVYPITTNYELNASPEFTRVRVRRDGR